jgi:hypothetical protein
MNHCNKTEVLLKRNSGYLLREQVAVILCYVIFKSYTLCGLPFRITAGNITCTEYNTSSGSIFSVYFRTASFEMVWSKIMQQYTSEILLITSCMAIEFFTEWPHDCWKFNIESYFNIFTKSMSFENTNKQTLVHTLKWLLYIRCKSMCNPSIIKHSFTPPLASNIPCNEHILIPP